MKSQYKNPEASKERVGSLKKEKFESEGELAFCMNKARSEYLIKRIQHCDAELASYGLYGESQDYKPE